MNTKIKLKIKTGDRVEVLTGKDRGKSGKVIQTFPATGRVVVEGVNQKHKQLRPRRGGEKGQIVDFWGPLDASNVALLCPKCGKKTRIQIKTIEGDKRVRACRKCKEVI